MALHHATYILRNTVDLVSNSDAPRLTNSLAQHCCKDFPSFFNRFLVTDNYMRLSVACFNPAVFFFFKILLHMVDAVIMVTPYTNDVQYTTQSRSKP